jgi:hypothetical protein
MIERQDLSDNLDFRRMDEKVKVGMVINARVASIEVGSFTIRLTCKTSDLQDAARWELPEITKMMAERWLVPDSPPRPEEMEKPRRVVKPKLKYGGLSRPLLSDFGTYALASRYPRVVTHPLFKNCGAPEGEAYLRTQVLYRYLFLHCSNLLRTTEKCSSARPLGRPLS